VPRARIIVHRSNGECEVVDCLRVYVVDFDGEHVVFFTERLSVEVGHFVSGDTADVRHNLRAALEIVALCFCGELIEHRRCGLPVFNYGFETAWLRNRNIKVIIAINWEVGCENAADAVFFDCVVFAHIAVFFNVRQNGIVIEFISIICIKLIIAVFVFILMTGTIFIQEFCHTTVVEHKNLPCVGKSVIFLVGFEIHAVPVRREFLLESLCNVLEVFFELRFCFVAPTVCWTICRFCTVIFECYVLNDVVNTDVCVGNELFFKRGRIARRKLLLTITLKTDDIR